MTNKVKEFLRYYKEDLKKPIHEIDWKTFYDNANTHFDDIYSVGEITCLFLDKNKHPEYYMSYIPEYFLAGSPIKEFKIPSHIEKIDASAFQGCENLTKIIIPSSVKVIEEFAFASCTNLHEVIFEGKVEEISYHAFSQTDSLSEITIPGGTGLGDYVFSESSLRTVYFKGTVEDFYLNGFDYGMHTFANTDVSHITCTDGVINL